MTSRKRPGVSQSQPSVFKYFKKVESADDVNFAVPIVETREDSERDIDIHVNLILPGKGISNTPSNMWDIGIFAGNQEKLLGLSVAEKITLLKSPWKPDSDYCFPTIGKRNLRFQIHWSNQWPWLTYSHCQLGAFCNTCVLFAGECAGKQIVY